MKKRTPSSQMRRGLSAHDNNKNPRSSSRTTSALFAQALAHHQAGNFSEAIVLYKQILTRDNQHVDTLNNLGTLQMQLGFLDEGISLIRKLLEINPQQPIAHMNLGNALHSSKLLNEALISYDRAIMLKPDLAIAYYNRGNTLNELERTDEALVSYDRAITLNPEYAQAYFNRGNILQRKDRPIEALENYDRAIAVMPDFAEAYFNRAFTLNSLHRLDEALATLDNIILITPGDPKAHFNRGNALKQLMRLDEALTSYDRAITLDPAYADAHFNRGDTLMSMKRYDYAQASYAKTISINPDFPYATGSWLHSKMHCCDWKNLDTAYSKIIHAVEIGKKATHPFYFLSTTADLTQQQRCAQIYIRDKHPASQQPLCQDEHHTHERVRVGYFSADFFNHATAHLIAELFERHDHSKFEIIGFYFGPPTDDVWHQRLKKTCERFFDVRSKSDEEIAALAHEQEIDIVVDLKGHTQDSRTGIFALRPAPIQINYLGYPSTMGADYIDYLIADHTLIPLEHQRFYNEKIIYLPHSYQVNNSTKVISDRTFTRPELSLPDDAFVFCCFNNNYKITPDVFSIWMRLLDRLEGSVLWLIEGGTTSARNLRLEAVKRGVSPDRLVFAPRMELSEHLSRHRQADLFLDTFYYNAHTTASDALWAGLPVLTCLGDTFAGRVSASLLNALGLSEMVTHNHTEYESLAIELATQPERLAAIRQKLALNRTTHPLFDTASFTHHIETAYIKIYERYQAGLPPDRIEVHG